MIEKIKNKFRELTSNKKKFRIISLIGIFLLGSSSYAIYKVLEVDKKETVTYKKEDKKEKKEENKKEDNKEKSSEEKDKTTENKENNSNNEVKETKNEATEEEKQEVINSNSEVKQDTNTNTVEQPVNNASYTAVQPQPAPQETPQPVAPAPEEPEVIKIIDRIWTPANEYEKVFYSEAEADMYLDNLPFEVLNKFKKIRWYSWYTNKGRQVFITELR